MDWAKILTPKDTEEIKPGLYIRKTKQGYRQVHPMAWNGEIRWKQQLRTIFSLRTFFTIAIILFLAWSYTHDVQAYKIWYTEVMSDPISWCLEVIENKETMDLPALEVNNEQQNPPSISNYRDAIT